MAGFKKFHEFALNTRIEGRVAVLEVVDVAFEKGILLKKFDDAKGSAAHGPYVHAAIVVTLHDFKNFGGATHAGDAFGKGQEHAELGFFLEAIFHHLAVPWLENVQRHFRAGEEDDVQGKQRNAFRPHGSQDFMIAERRGGCRLVGGD
jgi:hypothetical protein